MTEPDEDPWILAVNNGRLVAKRPWCDCAKAVVDRQWPRMVKDPTGYGYVRPCCMRPMNRASWEKHEQMNAEAAASVETERKAEQ